MCEQAFQKNGPISILFALLAFAAQLRAGPLLPGEFLHIGLALGLLLLGRSLAPAVPQTAQ